MEFLSSFSGWCGGPGAWGGGSGWGGMMPFHFGGIFQLIIIGLIIYFVARMFRRPTSATGPSPDEILKKRYASGEIDEQTYTKMKDDLK